MLSQEPCAYLGMYDLPALRPAQDAWWLGLAGHFRSLGFNRVPDGLSRNLADPYDIWLSPGLFLAQTCGYPLTHRLAGKVGLIGAPCYRATGCRGAMYRSLFIVRSDSDAENLAGALPARVAVNATDSHSGWRALVGAVESLKLDGQPFSEIIISGGHAESIDLVRRGGADLAAIDCVSHALIGDVEARRLAGTRVLQQSPAAPGLPYITAPGRGEREIARMAEAIQNAFVDHRLEPARRVLRLAGFTVMQLRQYTKGMK